MDLELSSSPANSEFLIPSPIPGGVAQGCVWLEGSHEGQLFPWEGQGGLVSLQTGVRVRPGGWQMASQMVENTAQLLQQVVWGQ